MIEILFELDAALCHTVSPLAGKCVHHLCHSDSAVNRDTFVQQLKTQYMCFHNNHVAPLS